MNINDNITIIFKKYGEDSKKKHPIYDKTRGAFLILPDDTIRNICDKIIIEFYKDIAIQPRHLLLICIDTDTGIQKVLNYTYTIKRIQDSISMGNLINEPDERFFDKSGEFIYNEITDHMNETLIDTLYNINELKGKGKNQFLQKTLYIECIDVFKLRELLEKTFRSKLTKQLYNGTIRKYFQLKAEDNYIFNEGIIYNKRNVQYVKQINKTITDRQLKNEIILKNNTGAYHKTTQFLNKIILLKKNYDIGNCNIDLFYLFINLRVDKHIPFCKLNKSGTTHMKLYKHCINSTSKKGFERIDIERWIKTPYMTGNYGGIPRFINLMDSILFKVISKSMIFSIILSEKGTVSIMIDNKDYPNTLDINKIEHSVDNLLNFENKMKFIFNNKILNIINKQSTKKILDNISNKHLIEGSIDVSNLYIQYSDMTGYDPSKMKTMIKSLKSYFRHIKYSEVNYKLDSESILCQYIRISNYDSSSVRYSLIKKASNAGKTEDDIIDMLMEILNINNEEAQQEYIDFISQDIKLQKRYDYILESGIDIKINNIGNNVILRLENVNNFNDYYFLISALNSMFNIMINRNRDYDKLIENKLTNRSSPKKEKIKTPRPTPKQSSPKKEKIKTPRPTHIQSSPKKEKIKTPRPTLSPKESDKDKTKMDDSTDSSSLSDSGDISDEFLGGGGDLIVTSYFLKRLKHYNKDLFSFKPVPNTSYNQNYTRRCQSGVQTSQPFYFKHPIVVSQHQLSIINESPEAGPFSYNSYGEISTVDKKKADWYNYISKSIVKDDIGNNYIAPDFWDTEKNIPIRSDFIFRELSETKTKTIEELYLKEELEVNEKYKDKLIPFKFSKGTHPGTILQRVDYQWLIKNTKKSGSKLDFYLDKNTKTWKSIKQIYVNKLDTKYHPKGLTMLCCNAKPIISDSNEPVKKEPVKKNPVKKEQVKTDSEPDKQYLGDAMIQEGYMKANQLGPIPMPLLNFFNQKLKEKKKCFRRLGVIQDTSNSFINSINTLLSRTDKITNNRHTISEFAGYSNGRLIDVFFTNYDDNDDINITTFNKQLGKNTDNYWGDNKYYTNISNHIKTHGKELYEPTYNYLYKLYNAYENWKKYLKKTSTPDGSKKSEYLIGWLENELYKIKGEKVAIIVFEDLENSVKIKNSIQSSYINIEEVDKYILVLQKGNKIWYEPIVFVEEIQSKLKHKEEIFDIKDVNPKIKTSLENIKALIYRFQKNNIIDIENTQYFQDVWSVLSKINPKYKGIFDSKSIFIDSHNNVKYIVCQNGLILPVKPVGLTNDIIDKYNAYFIYTLPIKMVLGEFVNAIELLNGELLNHDKTPKIVFQIKGISIDNDNWITQIHINNNNITVPLKSRKYTGDPKMLYGISIINNTDYQDVDLSLLDKVSEKIPTKYDTYEIEKQLYNECVFKLMNIINEKNKVLDEIEYNNNNIILIRKDKFDGIMEILKENLDDQFNERILYQLTNNIINNGVNLERLLNIKTINPEDIQKNIGKDEIYFTYKNMNDVFNLLFTSSRISNNSQTFKVLKDAIPDTQIKDLKIGLNHFSKYITGIFGNYENTPIKIGYITLNLILNTINPTIKSLPNKNIVLKDLLNIRDQHNINFLIFSKNRGDIFNIDIDKDIDIGQKSFIYPTIIANRDKKTALNDSAKYVILYHNIYSFDTIKYNTLSIIKINSEIINTYSTLRKLNLIMNPTKKDIIKKTYIRNKSL